MHLDEGQIQRLLHGELDARSARHVAECNACAKRLANAEREENAIFDLLRHVDHPAPPVDAEWLAIPRGALATWGRRAAGVVVAAALAGAAYAIPGSPLPAMVKKVAQWITGGESSSPDSTVTDGQPVASGIAVPVSDRFEIHFAAEQPRGRVVAWLADGPNVVVRVLGGTATFTTDAGRLSIDNRGSTADFEIEVPRGAPRVEIYLGARRLLLKEGERMTADFPADQRGRVILPLAAPGE
jgi:hypothetical protein